jgi:hypothetical protein
VLWLLWWKGVSLERREGGGKKKGMRGVLYHPTLELQGDPNKCHTPHGPSRTIDQFSNQSLDVRVIIIRAPIYWLTRVDGRHVATGLDKWPSRARVACVDNKLACISTRQPDSVIINQKINARQGLVWRRTVAAQPPQRPR